MSPFENWDSIAGQYSIPEVPSDSQEKAKRSIEILRRFYGVQFPRARRHPLNPYLFSTQLECIEFLEHLSKLLIFCDETKGSARHLKMLKEPNNFHSALFVIDVAYQMADAGFSTEMEVPISSKT